MMDETKSTKQQQNQQNQRTTAIFFSLQVRHIGADSMGAIAPHGQKVVGAMPASRPHRNFTSNF